MSILHTKGLSFRKKRKKVNSSSAKNAALWALEIIVVLVVAFMIVYLLTHILAVFYLQS